MDHPSPPLGDPGDSYSVAFDATPLAVPSDYVGGHTLRGIGRYISGLLDALVGEQPAWADQHLRAVVTSNSPALTAGRPISTHRAAWRPQDTGWWTAWIADRLAISGARPSLWHSLDPNMPLSPLAARQTVVTAYDLIPVHEPSAMEQIRPHRRPVFRLYLRSLRKARLVLAISDVTARDLHLTLGVDPGRIRVVYPAVPVPPSSPPDRAIPSDTSPDLLFVGVPDPTKQPELAVVALGELHRRGHALRLRFVGYQRPSDRVRLTALAAAHGVEERVEYLGRVDDQRLTELYRHSVLLAVSRIEGFGLPPSEALMAGGRVVCGTAPVYREVLGDAPEYAISADATGLADAYEMAASRPAAGPPPALVDRLSPRATAAALIAAYEEALDGARAR